MSRVPTVPARARAAVVALCVLGFLLSGLPPSMLPRAEAATTTLAPDSDVSDTWQVKPGGLAWDAVNDSITQPTAVPATDYLWAAAAGKVADLGMSTVAVGTNTSVAGQAWFYGNTGAGTQLKVEAVWGTVVGGSVTVAAGQGFGWRSVTFTPSAQADVDNLRLRFTSIGGGDTNVRAAYVSLQTTPLLRTLTWENAADRTIPQTAPAGWNPQYCCTYSAQMSTSVVRSGGYSSRFELRKTDPNVASSRRAELASTQPDPDGSERWYGFSIYLPADTWAPDTSAEILTQWHQSANTGSPPLSIGTRNGNWEVAQFANTPVTLSAYGTNRWTDWVVHVRWSSDPAVGTIEIWRDGVLVFSRPNAASKAADGAGVYSKFGIYKWDWANGNPSSTTLRVASHDELRIGDQTAGYAAVAPR